MIEDEPMGTFANLEISCPMDRSQETSASLDHYMALQHASKQQPQHQQQEAEVSFVFPPNHKSGIHNSDDTTCNTSISTFHSVASGSSTVATVPPQGPIHNPQQQDEAAVRNFVQTAGQLSYFEDHEQQQPRKRRLDKGIEFILDDDGNVFCDYLEPEGPLTEDEKQAVWWQPMEFKLFRRYCKKAAQLARNSEYAEHFTKVFDACSQKHITDVREHCHISRTHARGLEVVVFPTLVQARKLVIKGVVKTQEKLPATMDADQRAKVLSATSRCLTGRSRLLSRVFAVGDEEIAKDCYYSMK